MLKSTSTHSTRAEQWAARENARRFEENRRADFVWARADEELRWMIATGRSGRGSSTDQSGCGLVLKRGESLLGGFGDCRLIEVKRAPGVRLNRSSGFSVRLSRNIRVGVGGSRGSYVPGAEELRVTDQGHVAISNRRVVFQGGLKTREWTFSKLVGVQHDPQRPISLIQVTNRLNVSGISYPAEQAAQVRFVLELGAAIESGTVHQLVSYVEGERAQHARVRPVPLPPVTAADAPSVAARVGAGAKAALTGKPGQSRRRRVIHTAIAGGAALLLLNAGVGAMNGSSAQPAVGLPIPAATTAAAPTPTASTAVTQSARATATPTSPKPTPTQTIQPDVIVKKVKLGARPVAPKLLPTHGTPVRVGAICRDGSHSDATGRGACSWHKGVRTWLYEQPYWVAENKAKNAARMKKYKAALKTWNAQSERNKLLTHYPCSKGPYPKGKAGYAPWRDTNHNDIACDR